MLLDEILRKWRIAGERTANASAQRILDDLRALGVPNQGNLRIRARRRVLLDLLDDSIGARVLRSVVLREVDVAGVDRRLGLWRRDGVLCGVLHGADDGAVDQLGDFESEESWGAGSGGVVPLRGDDELAGAASAEDV